MNSFSLDGRVAIVTGGASGMGRAMVEEFLAAGARVVLADLNEDRGRAALAELAESGNAEAVRFVRTNVALEADVAAAVAFTAQEFGQLDVLCNNAGIGGAFGHITQVEAADWDETFAVLVRSVFLGCKHGARQMIQQGWGGSIINTASVAGMTGGAGPSAYSSAKAAVINLTRSVALELASDKIRVNAICPGAIDTPLLRQGRAAGATLERFFQPLQQLGRPDDIAATARFLASDASRFITGEAIVVDGGLLASGPTGWGLNDTVPAGYAGMNRGTTGQGPTVRIRP